MEPLLQLLGQIVAYGGGGAVVAFLVFRYLGKQWLDERFAMRLDSFRHEQAKELQRMRVDVESLLSGALKLQEREFTVLPEAWNKLAEAFAQTDYVVHPLQSYLDVLRVDLPKLEEYLAASTMPKSDKDRLMFLRLESKDDEYDRRQEAARIIARDRLSTARMAVADLQRHLRANGLFLPPPLKEQFVALQKALLSMIIDTHLAAEDEEKQERANILERLGKAEVALHEIERGIEQRLHSYGRPNAPLSTPAT